MSDGTPDSTIRKKFTRQKTLLQTVFHSTFHENTPVQSTPDLQIYLQNSQRIQNLKQFRKTLLIGLNLTRPNLIQKFDDLTQLEKEYEYIYKLAADVNKWFLNRHISMTVIVRNRSNRGKELLYALENYHWIILAGQNQSNDLDLKIWEKYAVAVEGLPEEIPIVSDPNYVDMETLKERAGNYFLTKLQDQIHHAKPHDLIDALMHITQLSTCTKLFSFLLPQLLSSISHRQFQEEVLPKICLFAIITKKNFTVHILEAILKRCQTYVTSDLVNSILEYSSHTLNLNLTSFLMDTFKDLIKTEGILCGLLAATIKGNEQLMAVYQFYIIEKLTETFRKDNGLNRFELETEISDFNQFVPPFIYILFAASSDAIHAVNTVIEDLIHFYDKDPMKEILIAGGISSSLHLHIIDACFNWSCKLNHFNVVSSLLESSLIKSNLMAPIYNSVKEGHQKILHLLLKSLLDPDPAIDLPYGAVPVCFRKSQALKLLPIIANRFPLEATWFINELSNIPIPIAVPPGEDSDPVVKSKMIPGVMLGSAKLSEVVHVPDTSIPHDRVWAKVDKEGQLRKSSNSGGSTEESECVICMIPDIFLKETAVREGVSKSKIARETNSLIRLLSTENEDIVLSPVVQGLMEYHWASGKFWFRFALQFLSMVLFITLTILMFSNIQMPGTRDYIISSIAVLLAVIFLVQEVRQYIDDSEEYIKSGANLIDVLIYNLTIAIVISRTFFNLDIHSLVKAMIILFSTMRLVLHLRIFPSVGPIVRITSSALLNVVPILVPMSFLLIAYSAAFYILHQGLIGPESNFNSFWISLQYTTTMITFDYTMLQHPTLFPVFLLRIVFHANFLICFINLIVALMTVNVADVTSNMRAAWLVEISQLMIELELYWPMPYYYNEDASDQFYDSISIDQEPKLGKAARFSINTLSKKTQDQVLESINLILYTAPRDVVAKSSWWTDYPKISSKGAENERNFGSALFDFDLDMNMQVSGPAPIETFGLQAVDDELEESENIGLPKILEQSSSNFPWVNTPKRQSSFNSQMSHIGGGLRRQSTLLGSGQNKSLLTTVKGSQFLHSNIHLAEKLGASNLKLNISKYQIMPDTVSLMDSIPLLNGVDGQQQSAVYSLPNGIPSANGDSLEQVKELEKLIKIEFKKNRELMAKLEQQQRFTVTETPINNDHYLELLEAIHGLKEQFDAMQSNRGSSFFERMFNRRISVTRRVTASSQPTKNNTKKTFPFDENEN